MKKKKVRKKILLIDDAHDIRLLLSSLLSANHYEVDSTSNGEEALSLLKNGTYVLPDLILLDTQMPVMDGFQFRAIQCLDNELKNIPVIITTADDNANISQKMQNPLAVFKKPFPIEKLLKTISDCLAYSAA